MNGDNNKPLFDGILLKQAWTFPVVVNANNFRITNAAPAINPNDYVTLKQANGLMAALPFNPSSFKAWFKSLPGYQANVPNQTLIFDGVNTFSVAPIVPNN